MAPIEGGDEPIRRLDTQVVNLIEGAIARMDSENYSTVASIVGKLIDVAKGGDRMHET